MDISIVMDGFELFLIITKDGKLYYELREEGHSIPISLSMVLNQETDIIRRIHARLMRRVARWRV